MLVAAAFCPAPPLLHPDVGSAAAAETAELRAACVDAVTDLVTRSDSDLVVAVGVAPRTGPYPVGARGSLHGLGVEVALGGAAGPEPELPLPLGLAAWLLALAAPDARWLPFGVAGEDVPARCAALGAALGDRASRVALLVMGDGSACRDPKAPGSLDPRAEAFDTEAFAALGSVDLDALDAIDPAIAESLMVSGRAPWQVAAGAARAAREADARFDGALIRSEAPYGVGYAVASWHDER